MKQLALMEAPKTKRERDYYIREYGVQVLRERTSTKELVSCESPDESDKYWREFIATHAGFDRDSEHLYVLLLNTRRRVTGHYHVSTGVKDMLLADPGKVFRVAVLQSASAMILMHNHPSGDPTPSEGDIKVTRDLVRAGQVLQIELLDHVIVGERTDERPRPFISLRELGYFYQ